ncbi:MAG: HAD family hydrolase [Cyanobacteria bacterium P01_G01_bin.39]
MSITITCKDSKFHNIAAIIFDKDGTLEDSGAYWRLVAAERARLIDAQIPGVGEPLLMAFGVLERDLDPQGLMACGSRYENEIAAAAYIAETGKSWHESKKIAHSAFSEVAESKYLIKNPQSAPLYDDVTETLQLLAHRGLKIGILSADSTQEVENFVVNHQLQDYLQLCRGTDGTMTKPDPKIFLQACESLQILPEQTLMVGDTIGDIVMAQKAGAAGAIAICRNQNQHLYSASQQIDSLSKIQAL